METAVISKQTTNYPLPGLSSYSPANQQQASFTALAEKKTPILKAGAAWALTAVEKVLKLNILGADINTEYLELSIRVYAGVLMLCATDYVKQFFRKTLDDKNIRASLFIKQAGIYALKNVA